MKDELAIIIPAYKARFLEKALASVAIQTTKDFALYVFDDDSPNPIQTIVHSASYKSGNSVSYERFENNLGSTNLTKHYDRCIRRTKEPWIWLFSDDDMMEESCVEAFWKTLRESGSHYDVYCFDSIEIGADDRVTGLHPPLPSWESWKQYAYFLFRGCRTVPQQAMIFSRAAYERLGAVIEFPLGWASDQATLMALASENGIKQISGAKVCFRKSEENISSIDDAAMSTQKLQASIQFMRWVVRRLDEDPGRNFPMSNESLRRLAFEWFKRHLAELHSWYSLTECMQTAQFMSRTWREPYPKALARMLRLNFGTVVDVAKVRLSSSRQSC